MATAILARAGPSKRRPFIQHSVACMQTRHNNPTTAGVASWKLNKVKVEHKVYKREHENGIFRKLPDSMLMRDVFEPHSTVESNFPEFGPDVIRPDMVGQPTMYASPETGPIRWFGTPKPTLIENRVLSRPCTIIRDTTLDMVELVERATDIPSSETRICYTGRAGTGKSHLLLQTVQYCHAKNWIVIYIPRAYTTVNSTTTHVYDLRTHTYLQPFYSFQLLQRILSANTQALETLQTTATHEFEKSAVQEGSSLKDLISAGMNDQFSAPFVLDALMTELGKQDDHPVLLAVDDFQALYTKTMYKDPHFEGISSYHLSVPRLIMQYASGQRTFNRGAFFAAVTSTNSQFPISNDLQLGLDLDQERPVTPYSKQRKTLQSYLKGILPVHIPDGMTVTEAAGLFDIWVGTKGLSVGATDSIFMAKYTESGGNPREFLWNGLLRSFDTPALVIDRRKPYPHLNVA